jgi:hypothetical protein
MIAHLRSRNLWLNVMTHDIVERLRIRRKSLAGDAGLDESYDVGTYPPGPETVTVKKGLSPVASVLLSGLMMGLGGGGAMGVAALSGAFDRPELPAAISYPSEQVFDITVEEVGDGQPLKVEAVPVDESQE